MPRFFGLLAVSVFEVDLMVLKLAGAFMPTPSFLDSVCASTSVAMTKDRATDAQAIIQARYARNDHSRLSKRERPRMI